MGLLNKIWSGADFWDKKENKQQRDNFAQKDDEERKRKQAEAQARAQAQAQQRANQQQQSQQQQQQQSLPVSDLPRKPLDIPASPTTVVAPPKTTQQIYKPVQMAPNPLLNPSTLPITKKAPLPDMEFKGFSDKGTETKRILGADVGKYMGRFGTRKKVGVDRNFTTNKDKMVAQFDTLDDKRKRILIDSLNDQIQEKKDAEGNVIPVDQASLNTWNALKAANRLGHGRGGALQRGADFASVPGRSVMRVGTGIAQGVSGAWDLFSPADIAAGAGRVVDQVTPGTGKSGFTQAAERTGAGNSGTSEFLTNVAANQDKSAKQAGVETAFKTLNIPVEVASYFIPGTLAVKGTNFLNKGAKTAGAIGKYSTKVDDVAKFIDRGGDVGKIRIYLANRLRQNFTVEEAIQELLITGRYMGQNTASGGDTSVKSVAIDVLTGLAGGLLVPAGKNTKNLDEAGVDDVTGATIAGGTEYLDNAITKGADIPGTSSVDDIPVRPEIPQPPKSIPVAPGVNSTNLVNGTPDVPTPTPTAVPANPNVTPPPAAATSPLQPQTPVGPRVNETPQVQQPIEVPQKPVQLEQAPTPVQVVPETAPVTTPIKEASQEVIQNSTPVVPPKKAPAPVPTNATDDALGGLRSQREDLVALRDAIAAEGGSTVDLDRQIAQLDKNIAAQSSKPTKEATVLAEGDQQLAEATTPTKQTKKPEISKQETPSKPKKETNVKNVNFSADELRARGVSEEGIAREMARQADEAAPKTKKTKKADVAQSEATPVKPESKAKTVDDARALDKEIADIRAQGEALGMSEKVIQEQIDKVTAEANLPKKTKSEAIVEKVLAEQTPTVPVKPKELPSKPKKPTQAQLNKAVSEAPTTKSGKVTAAWKNEQKAAGATDEQIAKAVEKVEGRKIAPTPDEKELAARRAENNKVGRENKKKAEAEGKDKQAAPGVTKTLADQTAKATTSPEEAASIGRRYSAQTKGVNIEEGMNKAQKSMDEISDDGVLEHVRKLLDETTEIDDAERVFNSIAISKRLDTMRQAAGKKGLKLDDDLIKLADEIAQTQALTASNAGLVNRLTQEIYKNVPAPVRVQKRLDDITKGFEDMKIEFKPSEADKARLIELTDEFDKSSTAMLGFEDELTANMADFTSKTTPEEAAELFKKHKQLDADHVSSQKEAVANSLAFNEMLKSILPDLPKAEKGKKALIDAPDHVGNYLRLAMLSAPSGRLRDAGSTALNVADQGIVNLISSTIGKGSNKLLGTNVINSYGSVPATRKGITGAWDKVKASWSGKPTLDEATGRRSTHNRAELSEKDSITSFGIDHGSKGSKYNLPKKAITTGVQVPTDTSFGLFTDRLYKLGEVDARSKGITDKKMIKQYAEMFMDNPTKEAALDAGDVWLGASGMQKNKLSKKLTKVADQLEAWGKKTVDSDGNKLNTAQRAGRKTLAVTVRTTTIPFVQYTGGSTHAMLMRQNPVSNVSQLRKAWKAGNTQAVVDNLSRTIWNTGKIAGLIGLMESNVIETSDVDADGVTSYNGPYVVRNGQYVPMGSYGIAGGAALISAHYLRRGYDKMKNGDVIGGISDIVAGPPMAIVKASGLDNMLSGTNILGGATENFEQANSDPDMSPGEVASTVAAGIGGDLGSQAVPAASRDLNSGFDNGWEVGGKTIIKDTWNPTKEKPDTSGKDPLTGKVDPWKKAYGQVGGGIPVVSQTQFPRKSGEQARTFEGRVYNANTQSAQQAAEIKAKEAEKTTTINRTADVVKDDKIANLLSEETRAIYDKYKGDMSKVSQEDSKTIWKEVSAAKDRLIDDGQYDSYKKILTYERDEAKAKGSSTATEIGRMDRNITRADIASKYRIDAEIYRLYTGTDKDQGGGISQEEFAKMIDEDSEYFDMDTATALWELDKKMTAAGVSLNGNGINPWTRQKYKMPDDKKGKGGSGSKGKGVGTGFGTLGAYAKPSSGSQAQKYKGINTGSPLANLTKSSSKTNLKKNISVVKGVRL